MKKILMGLLLLSATGLGAQTVLINLLQTWPVFNLRQDAAAYSRTLAPGNRLTLQPTVFSGLGVKPIALTDGTTYYLAQFQGPASLYRLAANQALVINASGEALNVRIVGAKTASGLLANGSYALGEVDPDGSLSLEWSQDWDHSWSAPLTPGKVYRLELGSPDGLGTQPILNSWD